MSASTADLYRRPLFDPRDDLFSRCLLVSSALGVLFTVTILLLPAREAAITHVTELPERLARLILEKPAAPLPPVEVARPKSEEKAKAEEPVLPEVRPRRPDRTPRLDPDAGRAGRERAQREIREQLASTTASLQRSLDELSGSLQSSTEDAAPTRRRRARRVRSGRTGGELGSVSAGLGGGGADLEGSAVRGSRVDVGRLATASGGSAGAPGGTAESGGASPPGVHRSNASLLAVIQKYSAGIQYCYANELKRDVGLRGKLVVAITVSPSGQVTNAGVVSNSMGSKRLADCALSQIRDWRFPAVDGGSTTFQAPFVFTPPS